MTTRRDRLFGYDLTLTPNDPRVLFMGDDNYSAGYVQLIGYPDEQHDLGTAAAVLRESGWQVDPVREEPGSTVLTASTAHLSLEARLRSPGNRLVVTIHRAPPPWVGSLTVIGWITGALAGWMLAGALARRASRQSPIVQLGIQTAVMCGLVFLTPVTVVVTTALAHAVTAPASSWLSPPWSAYTYPILRPVALAGAVFAAVAAGLATVAPPHDAFADAADAADAPSPTPIS